MPNHQAPQGAVAISLKDVLGQEEEESGSDVVVPHLDVEFAERDEREDGGEEPEDDDNDVEEFNLFGTTTRVRINSPEAEELEGVSRKRPESYYFAQFTDDDRAGFASAAVDAASILKESFLPYPGNAKPWRVLDYTKLAESAKQERLRKHKRPGKKSRMARKAKKEAGREKVAKISKHANAGPKYGPARTYANHNLAGKTKKKAKKPHARGVSGQGGHPRKGGAKK